MIRNSLLCTAAVLAAVLPATASAQDSEETFGGAKGADM